MTELEEEKSTANRTRQEGEKLVEEIYKRIGKRIDQKKQELRWGSERVLGTAFGDAPEIEDAPSAGAARGKKSKRKKKGRQIKGIPGD